MGDCGYLPLGDVKVSIEWTLHEQDPYESDAAPDVDNILKPLLDVLCGPDGILIDDCLAVDSGGSNGRIPLRPEINCFDPTGSNTYLKRVRLASK